MNALVNYDESEYKVMTSIAKSMVDSGYFPDAKSLAQAVVKIQAGREVGIPPFASMAGINIIQGKPAFSANLIATLVDNHPRYDYRVIRADDQACVIEWFKDGKKAGESSFTIEEARRIKQWDKKKNAFIPLAEKSNWQNWTSEMLFARAMTRGQKRYAAGVAGGAPLYTAEELGADYDENGNVIDAPSITVESPAPEQVDEAIEDAGPETLMTIETACAVTTSKGEFYGQLDSETLANMTIGINKGLKKPDLPDDKRQEYLMKLNAIRTILQARESGELAS